MTSDEDPSPASPPDAVPAAPGGQGRRRRRATVTAVAAGLLLAAGAAVFATLSMSTSDGAGPVSEPLVDRTFAPAAAFSLPDLQAPSRHLSLADFRGKPLVLNFWASWCFPCQTEMPLLESASRGSGGTVQFVGVDTDDTRSAAVAFLRQHHVDYPSLYLSSGTGSVGNAYGLIGLPITWFISADGTVLGRHIGQLDAATLSAAMKLAFGHQPGATR